MLEALKGLKGPTPVAAKDGWLVTKRQAAALIKGKPPEPGITRMVDTGSGHLKITGVQPENLAEVSSPRWLVRACV